MLIHGEYGTRSGCETAVDLLRSTKTVAWRKPLSPLWKQSKGKCNSEVSTIKVQTTMSLGTLVDSFSAQLTRAVKIIGQPASDRWRAEHVSVSNDLHCGPGW